MSKSAADRTSPSYRIGAVSRLTGIAPDTLRVWERRYGAVVPFRSAKGSRLYSQEDVGRLSLIKRLVDSGDAISRVANLSTEQLQERLKGAPSIGVGTELKRPFRVVVLGGALAERLRSETTRDDELDIVGLYCDKKTFLAETPGLAVGRRKRRRRLPAARRGARVHQHPTRTDPRDRHALAALRCCARPRRVRFRVPCHAGSSGIASRYADSGAYCPPGASPLVSHTACTPGQGRRPVGRRRRRHFRAVAGAALRRGDAGQNCECPHHLVDLISSLAAFEAYSEDCEVRNVDDAALHAFLHAASAHARSLLETGLARVVEADNIDA